ncbi:metal-sensitive transcriptional regulator [Rhodopirellula europaea]|uniref:metal-sensitive transcriptional regulator n=1 Tax=Rhodopirellula europaea TaxID=1263866 RepID=UPI003D2C2FA0|tara:strand:- start:24793 stop:25086 length:294 start_codon:yes stop_codon:yes gene_type:complete
MKRRVERSSDDKLNLDKRLRRIGGQVDGVRRMIDEGEYCVDVLTQISAVTGALRKVGELVLEQHLHTCVRDAMRSDNDADREEKVAEILKLFQKQLK